MSSSPSQLTRLELVFLTATVVLLLVAFIMSDAMLRLVAGVLGAACGLAVYLLVARRLNEQHVDDVLSTSDPLAPVDDGRSQIMRRDPQTRRLVFEDYAPAFAGGDDDDDDDDRGRRRGVSDVASMPSGDTVRIVTGAPGAPAAPSAREVMQEADPRDEVRITRREPARPAAGEPKPAAPVPTAPPERRPEPAPRPAPAVTHRRKEINVGLAELFDLSAEQKGDEPRNEFDRLLHRVLETIAAILPVHSIAFFWIDRAKQHLVVEAKITQSATFLPARRIAMGQDVVSQIATSGLPEIVTEISPNAELDLLGYYAEPNGVSSFAGVPVYFNHEAVAVLALDAKDLDAYDAHTVRVLGQFTKLISGLIRGYTDKYDLQLSARAVEAVGRLRSSLPPSNATGDRIARVLLDVAETVVEWEWAGVALFDNAVGAWALAHADAKHGMPNVPKGQRIDLQQTVVGTVIRTGQPAVLADLGTSVRYARGEQAAATGSFLCLPLCTPLRSYGALCIEYPAVGHFSQHDVDTLLVLAQAAAAAIESHHLNKMIDEQLMIDERTGVYNKRYLLGRLDGEVTRAHDQQEELSFVLFRLDPVAGSSDPLTADQRDAVLVSVVRSLQHHLRTYDVVGRYDLEHLGVLLAGKSDEDAYLWGEKVRKDVASTVLQVGTRKLSATVSMGVCGLRARMSHVDLVNGAMQALQRAQEGGGNSVFVY